MIITEKCVGCRQCRPYCPVNAIGAASDGWRSVIDLEKCVECGTCLRSNVCPVNAIEAQDLVYPRSLRSQFSDVTSPHKSTGVLGRGTEEMKTNDVTGRLKLGRVNVSVELGRPGVSASLRDVEVIAQALAAVLKASAGQVDTVFSVGLAAPLRPDESEARLFQILRDHDVWHRPNGKTNVGLGRPFQEAQE